MKIKYSEDLSLRSCKVNLCTRSRASRFAADLKPHTSSIAFGLAAGPSGARQRPAHFEHSSLSSCEAGLLGVKRCFTNPATRSIASRLATRSSLARFNRVSGFTLLEVMVALAIFAVAAIALTKVAMQYTQSTSNAILRTKAQFVGMNEVAMMEINQEWLEGTQSKQVTSQGETWQIDKKAQSTISPKIQRIELQVSLFNNEQGKVEAGITNLVFFNYPAKARTQ
ncbi:type II secretion system minor pseudopilin GspI [Acinetobacter sp. TUM15071]|uniref:type II secretion system minor pseudopilin GspI n=1 Tax=Acinetobacter sp. TUM15071 TaxID=2609135 RepID=UPI00148F3D35